jgi:RNA polymerase sigma-70 factor, ECF subfamily
MTTPQLRAPKSGSLSAVFDAVLNGRPEMFSVVVRTYALPLRTYLAGHIYHSDDIDDLAQDVFLAALESLNTFRRGDDFWAWLRGIARHKVMNYYRSTARRDRVLDRFRRAVSDVIADDLDRRAEADRAEDIERLLSCITKLPDKLRLVVRAGLDGVKAVETAARMRTTVGVVYNLHYRANQLLRDCLKGDRP